MQGCEKGILAVRVALAAVEVSSNDRLKWCIEKAEHWSNAGPIWWNMGEFMQSCVVGICRKEGKEIYQLPPGIFTWTSWLASNNSSVHLTIGGVLKGCGSSCAVIVDVGIIKGLIWKKKIVIILFCSRLFLAEAIKEETRLLVMWTEEIRNLIR